MIISTEIGVGGLEGSFAGLFVFVRLQICAFGRIGGGLLISWEGKDHYELTKRFWNMANRLDGKI